MQSEILTVMFIDLAGYTQTTARLPRESLSEMHEVFDSISLPIFGRYGGKVVKKIGDAFLSTFKSPTDAVLCGIELQNAFRKHDAERRPPYPLRIRVALHTGEVVLRDGDIYGDAVNIAARIEGIAGPGEIVFSEATFLAMNKNEVPYVYAGKRFLKGVRMPIRVFRVKGHYDRILRRRKQRLRRRRLVRKLLFKVIALSLIVALVAFIAWYLANYTGVLAGLV